MSTPEAQEPLTAAGRYLPVAVPPSPGALLAYEEIAQRALAELARPQGGSLVVYGEPFPPEYWPHMPGPLVRATSIARAQELWPTRDFTAVFIGWDIPNPGVREFAERIDGVASCVRYVLLPSEGPSTIPSATGVRPPPNQAGPMWVEPPGIMCVSFGFLQHSWRPCDAPIVNVSSASVWAYSERCKLLQAPDRLLRRAASMVAWPRIPGPDLVA